MKKIAVIGCGSVGLTTAVGLADGTRRIICIDKDSRKLEMINNGICPFYEPELEEQLKKIINGSFAFETSEDFSKLENFDVVFICVGTPPSKDGSINLSSIKECSRMVGLQITSSSNCPVVVIRSTVVPGTTECVVQPILEKYSGKKAGEGFSLAANPEFLQEGKAYQNFKNPDRIIIGEYDSRAGEILESLYTGISAPIIRTNIRTAEMIKCASNAFLGTKISFINEIGNICKKLGIDVYDVADGIGYDPRIGRDFLNAGLGFGGSCLPKDINALIYQANSLGLDPRILKSIYETNQRQIELILESVRERLGSLEYRNISILGLTFKPDTDDIRETSAFRIIAELLREKVNIKVYDPMVSMDTEFPYSNEVTICDSITEAVTDSEGIIIVTGWDEFKDINIYTGKTVFDCRRVLDPKQAERVCLHYEGVSW
jgi:UDPglucose 6-dehydrogenase